MGLCDATGPMQQLIGTPGTRLYLIARLLQDRRRERMGVGRKVIIKLRKTDGAVTAGTAAKFLPARVDYRRERLFLYIGEVDRHQSVAVMREEDASLIPERRRAIIYKADAPEERMVTTAGNLGELGWVIAYKGYSYLAVASTSQVMNMLLAANAHLWKDAQDDFAISYFGIDPKAPLQTTGGNPTLGKIAKILSEQTPFKFEASTQEARDVIQRNHPDGHCATLLEIV